MDASISLDRQLFILNLEKLFNLHNLPMKNVMFADDTNIFVSADSIDDVYAKANSVLDNVYKYMIATQLHINMSETCYIHFSLRKLELDDFGLTKLFCEHFLELADVSIKSTTFLGLIIDEELSWLPQIK